MRSRSTCSTSRSCRRSAQGPRGATRLRAKAVARSRRPRRPPVLGGSAPGWAVYGAGRQRASLEVGIVPFDRRLPADASFDDVAEELERLNEDEVVSGMLLQLPVPEHLDGAELTGMIRAEKDVDGLTPVNAGLLSLGQPGLRPCTPAGVMELLADTGVALEGAESVVIGRSNLFGKPMSQLLLAANATVAVAHS